MRSASIGVVALVVGVAALPGESRSLPHFRQVASMRPADSLKVLPLPEAQKPVPVVESPALGRSECAHVGDGHVL